MEEEYQEWYEEQVSLINIPIRINAEELQRSLNTQMEGLLYDDKDINDGDDMMVKAEKKDDISLEIDSQMVKYRVPLGLWIKYDAGFMDVEATGDIALNFQTSFNINPDWSMQTITTIEGYEWLKKPRVSMIGITLPIGFIADIVLKNSKATIAQAIDDQVKNNLDLKRMIGGAWQQMYSPLLVSEEYKTWLTIVPQTISMTPLIVDDGEIVSTVVVESKPEVLVGAQPATPSPQPLPPFEYRQVAAEDFSVTLRSRITFDEVQRLAQTQLKGQTFESGKRSVTVKDIAITGQGSRLLVETQLSGSYEGKIKLSARPIYNQRRDAIDIKDMDFTLETKNVLYKTAGWLLKGTLRKEIQKNIDFILDDNMKAVQKQLQEQLKNYPITNQIFLNGNLDQLNIQNAFVTVDGLLVDVALRGQLQVQVNGLN